MRPTKRNIIGDDFGEAITFENFTFTLPPPDRLKPSEKNSRVRFMRLKPESYVIVRPDREGDFKNARYSNNAERLRGTKARDAWFEYFRIKARADDRWMKILVVNQALLDHGYCVQFVCEDPAEFDSAYLPSQSSRNYGQTKILNPFGD